MRRGAGGPLKNGECQCVGHLRERRRSAAFREKQLQRKQAFIDILRDYGVPEDTALSLYDQARR